MAQSADDLARHYRSLTDDEVLGIAATGELTDVADTALRAELARRQLGDSDIAGYGDVLVAAKAAESERTIEQSSRMLQRLKLYAYVLAIVSALIFVFGFGRYLDGDKSNGTTTMILAVILAVAGETKLWVESRFWGMLLRRSQRTARRARST
jgi:hypothetical protein